MNFSSCYQRKDNEVIGMESGRLCSGVVMLNEVVVIRPTSKYPMGI